jgi:low temperature requirement protein LtrA
VFVAAILVLSSAASHAHEPNRVSWVAVAFVALWWVWLQTTLFSNRFRVDDMTHRLLVLTQMFLVILVAMHAHDGVVHEGASLSLTYAAMIATVAVMYARCGRARRVGAAYARSRAAFLGISAAIFAAAAAVPDARGVIWLLAMIVSLGPVRWRHDAPGADAPALDERHLLERMGVFTIIVCGEAFVKVAVSASSGTVAEVDVIALAFQFVLTFAIWLSYFEDIPEAGLRRGRVSAWMGLHLLLQLGIAGTAISVAQLVRTDPFEHIPTDDILGITATLAAIYLALGLLGLCTRRVPVRPLLLLRLATSAATLLVGFGAWRIPWLDLVEGVALLTAVAVAYAVIGVYLEAETTVPDPPSSGSMAGTTERR